MNIKNVIPITIVILVNIWVNKAFQMNLFIASVLLLESILLFLSVSIKSAKFLCIVILVILSIYLLKNHFDRKIFSLTGLESDSLAQRHEYYANGLGIIYKNKVGLFYFNRIRPVLIKVTDNLAGTLDLSKYFLHSEIFTPFFIFGFFYLSFCFFKFPFIYLILALAVNMFINSSSPLNNILLFPFINLSIAWGIIGLIKVLKWQRS